jgi:hypothetical protein
MTLQSQLSTEFELGAIREVLCSDSEDIFHGLRVGLAGSHQDVMVPPDNVTSMSRVAVR